MQNIYTLYDNESKNQIYLSFSNILKEYPGKIASAIADFENSWLINDLWSIHSEIIKTTEALNDLDFNYRLPSSLIIYPENIEGERIRRLWTTEERESKNLDLWREDIIKIIKKDFEIDLSNNKVLPSKFLDRNIKYSEYFTYEIIPPESRVETRNWEEETAKYLEELVSILVPWEIDFPVNGLTKFITPESESKHFDIRNSYFTNGKEKYSLPKEFSTIRRKIIIEYINKHINQANKYRNNLLTKINNYILEYNTSKKRQQDTNNNIIGNITDKQTDILLNLIRKHSRLSQEEKIALIKLISIISKEDASDIIGWFMKEKK